MTFEDVLNTARKQIGENAAFDAEASAKTHELSMTRESMMEALRKGDYSEFNELTQKSIALEAALNSCNEKKKTEITVTEEDVVSSWNEHITTANKEFSEKMGEYLQARKALCAMYIELAEMQRSALEKRESAVVVLNQVSPEHAARSQEHLVSVCGRPECAYSAWGLIPPERIKAESASGIPVKYTGVNVPPEVACFIATGDLPAAKITPLLCVIKNFHPCSREEFEHPKSYQLCQLPVI